MFRRGIGFFDEFDGPSISSITSTIASSINKDNLQRAWEISSNAVTAIAETGERALRGAQTSPSWPPPNVPAGGIGRDIASFGRGRDQTDGFGYQGPASSSAGPATQVKVREKKKSHKSRGHRSEGDEEFEAARRRTQKKGHKKKGAQPSAMHGYSESSGEASDGEERRRREAEEKAQRKREREWERERERFREAQLALERERSREPGSDSKPRPKEKEHKEKKKKKDKDKERDRERHHRPKAEKDKERRHSQPGRSGTESADSEEKETPKAVLREQDFAVGRPRGPGQGEEELDRLFGFAALRPEQRRTLLDELFTPLGEEPAPPPPRVACVSCPECGCLFYPSEATRPPPDAVLPPAPQPPAPTPAPAAGAALPADSAVPELPPTPPAEGPPAEAEGPPPPAAVAEAPQAEEGGLAGPGPAEGTAPVELPDVDGEESQGDAVAKPMAPTEAAEPQP